jgi:catechol 2,3-dioxygenase-like lactoylglutathione lyase family enzyme
MATVSVRYIVDDVDAAIAFYCGSLGFEEVMHPAPTFAMLRKGDLRLALSAPGGGPGGGAAMPDGTAPAPGGWNRFMLEVDDLPALIEELRGKGRRSATSWSRAWGATRSSSRTRPATRSSSSSRPATRPA